MTTNRTEPQHVESDEEVYHPRPFHAYPDLDYQSKLDTVKHWFGSLSSTGQLFVTLVGAIALLFLLGTLLKLISMLIGIALLGIILLMLYRFLISQNAS